MAEENRVNLSADASAPAGEFPNLAFESELPRTRVVQALLDLFESPHYLEIGVQKGKTFNSVSANKKVAVDPKFGFDFEIAAKTESGSFFHEITSDDFFGQVAEGYGTFHVINLDGLHTSEQTTRDLLNAMAFLDPKGLIVIDDVFPSSYLASLRDIKQFKKMHKLSEAKSGAWMGDVFRLVFFVETFCQQFTYRTVNNNHGQLILWRNARRKVQQRTLSEVAAKEYRDIYLEKKHFQFAPLNEIIDDIIMVKSESRIK